jgi:hypothetical protein
MSSFRRLIHQYRNWILVAISGFVIPLATNLTSSWLEKTVGEGATQILQLIALLLAIVFATMIVLYLAGRPKPLKVLVTLEQQPPQFPGLILLIGPGRSDREPLQSSAVPAIEFHQPTRIWMLYSQAGVPVMEELRKKFAAPTCHIIPKQIDKPWDIHDTYWAVLTIYQSGAQAEGLEPDQVIADFTGGTHPMAAGVVLACQERWNMQYISGKPDTQSRPIWIQFNPNRLDEETTEGGTS